MMPSIPMQLMIDQRYVEALRKRLELTNTLCAALRDYLAFDTEQQIIQAEITGPREIYKFIATPETLIEAKEALDRAQKQLDAARNLIEHAHGSPQAEFLQAMLIPQLEGAVEMQERQLSQIQRQMESPS